MAAPRDAKRAASKPNVDGVGFPRPAQEDEPRWTVIDASDEQVALGCPIHGEDTMIVTVDFLTPRAGDRMGCPYCGCVAILPVYVPATIEGDS